jgi:hypothetical protein
MAQCSSGIAWLLLACGQGRVSGVSTWWLCMAGSDVQPVGE